MRQVFLDTETTGLDADGGDRIVEIGCIELVHRRRTEVHLHHYLNPQRASHPEALKVHGLSEAFLADKPAFADVADALLAFVAGAEVIIHNAAFDVGFLDAELRRIGRTPLSAHVARITDSLLLAREAFPGKGNSLDALCRRLEVDSTHRTLHGALLDAGLLAEVYLRLTRGQNVLAIDGGDSRNPALVASGVDLRGFDLPVLLPGPAEQAAHAVMVTELQAASGGRSRWYALDAGAWMAGAAVGVEVDAEGEVEADVDPQVDTESASSTVAASLSAPAQMA